MSAEKWLIYDPNAIASNKHNTLENYMSNCHTEMMLLTLENVFKYFDSYIWSLAPTVGTGWLLLYCDTDAILCASYSHAYLVSWNCWCWKGPPKQNHLDLLVHNHVQAALECLQGWRYLNLLGQASLLGQYRSVSQCSCSTFCVSPCGH